MLSTRYKNIDNKIRQRIENVGHNCISLPLEYTEIITNELNTDLATYHIIYLQLKKHHWVVEGPDWKHVHLALDEYATLVNKHIDLIAERIVMLEALPISDPTMFKDLAYIDLEEQDKIDLRTMLFNDCIAFQTIIKQTKERIIKSIENEDFGTEKILKDILLDQENIIHELDMYLKDESLEYTIKNSHKNMEIEESDNENMEIEESDDTHIISN